MAKTESEAAEAAVAAAEAAVAAAKFKFPKNHPNFYDSWAM